MVLFKHWDYKTWAWIVNALTTSHLLMEIKQIHDHFRLSQIEWYGSNCAPQNLYVEIPKPQCDYIWR